MADYTCEVQGCTADARKGDAIHRTSPKGGPFRGRCTAHFTGAWTGGNALAQVIEERNAEGRTDG